MLAAALVPAASGQGAGNDAFSSAAVLRAATGSYNGTNREATKESGEPEHAGNVGGASVWYRWTAPVSGIATFDTLGSGFDSLLAVYTGSAVEALELVAANDDAFGWKWTSKVGFTAEAGVTYLIAVDGYNDGSAAATGTFAVNWQVDSSGITPPNDTFIGVVPLTGLDGTVAGSSFGATKEVGEPDHAGNPGGASVWFRWTAPADGRFRFTTDGSTFNTLLAAYTGISVSSLAETVANDDVRWDSWQSAIEFDARKNVTYSIALDGHRAVYSGTASGDYRLSWGMVGPLSSAPGNDWLSRARTLSATGSVGGTTAGAGLEVGEPQHAGNLGGASVWFRWTAPADGTATFSTAGSGFDTLLAVYTGAAMEALALVAANDDSGAKGPSEISFAARGGETYLVALDGYRVADASAAEGEYTLMWTLGGVSPPANDRLADALELGGVGGLLSRSSVGATKESGEPDHGGNSGGASIWFKWRAPGDGTWRFYTSGSSFDTLLAVYTLDAAGALVPVAQNDNASATDRTSSLFFAARNDTYYYVAVDGVRGLQGPAQSGSVTILYELLGAVPEHGDGDDFGAARAISGPYGPATASNAQATKEPGEPDHAGDAGGASMWFKWTAPASGPVYFDTPGSSFDTSLAVYTGTSFADLRVVAANADIAYDHWWRNITWSASYVSFWAYAGRTYYVAVDGRATSRGPARGSIFLDWWQSEQLPADATLLAAGDVASCASSWDEQTAALLAAEPQATVVALGDNVVPAGADFACYDASWGAAKSRTAPAAGNVEFATAGAAGHFGYFGAAAGAPGRAWYSFEAGAWHVVVLNSNCDLFDCGPDGEQARWLKNDLLAHPNACVAGVMHHPLYSSADGASSRAVRTLWEILYAHGADIVLSSNARMYERFAPQAPDGRADSSGIRQFVVGTGGQPLSGMFTRAPNSEVVNASSYGVLRLVLGVGGYSWQFVSAAGGTNRDAGTGRCSGAETMTSGPVSDTSGPPAPGAPTPSATLTRASSITLKWAAVRDPNGTVKYNVEGTNGALAWTTLLSGISKAEASVPLAEGTWRFRVRAQSRLGVWGAASAESVAVVVDRTAPVPKFATSRPPDYAGGGGWWKGSLTVSFGGDDPALADGSAGSGVDSASVSAPVTKTGTGVFKVADRVKDKAGNESPEAAIYVQLDSAAPSVSLSCPGGTLPRGSERYATYSAKDDRSGLAVPATGSIRLDTSRQGKFDASVAVPDNVGNVKTATCTYTVG